MDPARKFVKHDYTDEEYASELKKIEERLVPFLDICKENHTAIRIGVNHGSLSDRIRNRYGDTPEGIVESCMEFLRICKKHDFGDVVISIKSSNTVVMVRSVRLLVDTMDKEDMHYPLHLGVTEAGEARGRAHKERRWHRRASCRRHRRHHTRVADRGARGGDSRGTALGGLYRPQGRSPAHSSRDL